MSEDAEDATLVSKLVKHQLILVLARFSRSRRCGT
jgi:hypothetical protein